MSGRGAVGIQARSALPALALRGSYYSACGACGLLMSVSGVWALREGEGATNEHVRRVGSEGGKEQLPSVRCAVWAVITVRTVIAAQYGRSVGADAEGSVITLRTVIGAQ